MKFKSIQISMASIALVTLSGCAYLGALSSSPIASADLLATKGNSTTGKIQFYPQASGGSLLVHAQISGLKPGQEHGFHIHEKGDCSSGDGMSTGGHFNPEGKKHGPQNEEHHAGDMPAIKADANGAVDMRFVIAGVSAGTGASNDVVGRGLIVHAAPDDYKTQPTGNSGARWACGVIRKL